MPDMYSSRAAPPPYYSTYDSRSPHTSAYYSPRYSVYEATPQSKHSRSYSYSTPKPTYYTSPHAYADPDPPRRTTSTRKADPVSGSDRTRNKSYTTRTYVVHPTTDGDGYNTYRYHVNADQKPYRSSHHTPNGVYADYNKEEYLSAYERKYRYSPPPPPYSQYPGYSSRDNRADDQAYYYEYSRAQAQPEESPAHKRSRRASYTTKPAHKPSTKKPPPTKATDEDARKAGIPAGYSTKHWDPTEEPILLLGSVFDANSLGKWIYDWTVACRGSSTPMSEIAGDLWLLLIQLAGKIKRAEKCLPRIRDEDNRDLIDDFIDSGERLWSRFNKLLKICESYMLKAAKKEKVGGSKKVVAGKNSGIEFVNCIFGRDRELQRTEKLMTGIRLWSMRFDANCESVLRNPSA